MMLMMMMMNDEAKCGVGELPGMKAKLGNAKLTENFFHPKSIFLRYFSKGDQLALMTINQNKISTLRCEGGKSRQASR